VIGWESWHTLLAAARSGTLAGAAAALGIDPTTAGRRLKRMEERLGKRLFERAGGTLEPTPACAALLPHLAAAETALAEAEAIAPLETAAAAPRVVRITSVALICDHILAPALPRLLRDRRLRVELIGDNRNLSVARGEADVAVRLGPPAGAGVPARPVGTLRYAVYAAAGADPDTLPWAGFDTTLAHLPEYRWVEKAAGRAGVAFRVNRTEAARSLATAGLAKALLPAILAEGAPGLTRIGPIGAVERPLWLILNTEDAEAPHIKAVARWIAEVCGAL
jgi:DNA-binding transcriptional LysR family regulator